jgi:Gluconate 2-dehydrogenase subunit 3
MSDERQPPESVEQNDEFTRRQWLLRLGELVTLAGVSGLLPQTAVSITPQQDQPATTSTLPPGLYGPSQDHLVHALSSGGNNWTPPPGSETEFAQPGSVVYQPSFFSQEEFAVVKRWIEILLGEVDSTASAQAVQWLDLWLFSAAGVRLAARRLDPMHRLLAVAYYGEESVRQLETGDPQSVARSGLRALGELAMQTYGKEFLQLSNTQQVEFVNSIAKTNSEDDLHKFLDLARAEAIRGYYTSAEGLKELDYRGNAYYGECPGCEKPS